MTALEVVHNSEALLAGPEFILNSELLENKFVKLTPPNELADVGEIIGLSQHRRTLSNPAHQWLTEKIASITATHWTAGNKKRKSK